MFSERSWDGIWAMASLIHVPLSDQLDAVSRLITSLSPGGDPV